ncbi:hypothetical protein BJ138DRAFT_1133285 [Hygrophoropsis aurantiaca]|uniref:Uncharacterized protein n=1 Tax=Hygrophoropsis aurantiaca TaxID=72124 RepID=A0ACB8AMB2_9AGAM|nr:hypothetical protein BJ138DRAFT_1133285 [Hygrophoropsis aurantiaca]
MAALQSSYLCQIPREVLEKIAFEVTQIDPRGPPSNILPLLLTCKQINDALKISRNPHLYAGIFGSRFDVGAAARRMGDQTTYSQYLARQLQAYCTAIRCIRRGDVHDPNVLPTFWTCFVMMMESDCKNKWQLEAVGLGDFVDAFVRTRLHDDSAQTNGWPKETAINSLALWLLWFTSTEERLRSESHQRRNEMIKLLLPYILLPFRYATAFAAHNHHVLPLSRRFNRHLPHSVVTAHGPYPVYRSGNYSTISYYDRSTMEMGIPLASVAAKLIFFSRRQLVPIGVPPHLPLTRAHAHQLGHTGIGPTQEDVHELNNHNIVKLPPPSTFLSDDDTSNKPSSLAWDDDWFRLTDCLSPFDNVPLKNTHYTPGSLDGLWQGRMLIPDDTAFGNLVVTPHLPANFSETNPLVNAAPVFMRLREYHCIDPQTPVISGGQGDDFDDGLAQAWLPSTSIYEAQNELHIDNAGRISKYERFIPGCPNSHNPATCKSCVYRGTDEVVYREFDSAFLGDGNEASDEELMDDSDTVEDIFQSVGMGRDSNEANDDAADAYDDEDMDVDDDSDAQSEYTLKKKCTGILDIMITGETDLNHGQAWNHYKFLGRVREWDGLIALVRLPRQSNDAHGRYVFTGYVVGGCNFVGTWRVIGHDVSTPTWESAFSMSRRT